MKTLAPLCDDAAMRSKVQVLAFPSEVGDFADEVRQIFLDLGRVFGPDSLAGECAPAIDLYESDDAMEMVVDLPGVDPSAVRVLSKGDSVLVAGEKPPRRVQGEATFHLVERGYGRFARAVRLARSCDMSRATAFFAAGELRITLPKIQDRRGVVRAIPVKAHA